MESRLMRNQIKKSERPSANGGGHRKPHRLNTGATYGRASHPFGRAA